MTGKSNPGLNLGGDGAWFVIFFVLGIGGIEIIALFNSYALQKDEARRVLSDNP